MNYYLRKYRVPPEPDLVEHIRSLSFTVPDVDEATKAAAAGFLDRALRPVPTARSGRTAGATGVRRRAAGSPARAGRHRFRRLPPRQSSRRFPPRVPHRFLRLLRRRMGRVVRLRPRSRHRVGLGLRWAS